MGEKYDEFTVIVFCGSGVAHRCTHLAVNSEAALRSALEMCPNSYRAEIIDTPEEERVPQGVLDVLPRAAEALRNGRQKRGAQ